MAKKYNLELRKSRVPIYRMRKKMKDCNNTCKYAVGRLRKTLIISRNDNISQK